MTLCRLRFACRGLAAALTVVLCAEASRGDPAPVPHLSFPISVDSGHVANNSDAEACLFAFPVHAPGANWLRVAFGEVQLPAPAGSAERAFLRLTSALDGAQQILDRNTLVQWRKTSAYFNGDTVLVELISPPGAGPCRVVIANAIHDGDDAQPRNICGPTDDRLPSGDPRVARLLPIGCTGWLIQDENFCFITAGHCATGSGLQVSQFNVPLSNSNGSLNHPPPEHQYAVDPASLQAVQSAIVIGNDWAYYGVFDNSNTGLTPYESQGGGAFALTQTAPVASGQTIRKTGCGTTDSSVPREWNQVQKTLAGPLTFVNGTALSYPIDSSGGDSGSPVFDETTGIAIAIHTNGGCTSGGVNHGCSVVHPDLVAALQNPKGVCIPRYFDFAYPHGRPSIVNPLGGTQIIVKVNGRNGYVPSQTGVRLHLNTGEGFADSQMIPAGDDLFVGFFPPVECTTPLRYFITAETADGRQSRDPRNAPVISHHALSASSVTTIAQYDFETAVGWTVQNINVAAGAWERGVPAGDGTRGDPTTDYDGSGQCWLTGNAPGDSDVDGGPTRLWSPSFNLSAAARPMMSYARWFTNDTGDDVMLVELSNNFGSTWSIVESVPNSVGWQFRYVKVSDVVPPSSITRIRFGVADEPNNSRTEAAIDAVHVFDAVCPAAGACRKGDINLDGRIDGRDMIEFVSILTTGGEPGTAAHCAADINGDSVLTLDDAALFVDCVLLGICN